VRSDAERYGCLPGEEIVAQNLSGADSCDGDSGGPLLVTKTGDGGTGDGYLSSYFLAGITSRGIAGANPRCGAGGIYERLTPATTHWIRTAFG